MNRHFPDTLTHAQRKAVESAGYRVARWSKARLVLGQRVERQRWSGELGVYLSRWAASLPPMAGPPEMRLTLGVQNGRLWLLRGISLASLPVERALLHLPALRRFWMQELRFQHFEALRNLLPGAWIMDEAKVPAGAVVSGLDIVSWSDVPRLQMERPGLLIEPPLVHESPASSDEFQAGYHLNEKGRLVLRSFEASS